MSCYCHLTSIFIPHREMWNERKTNNPGYDRRKIVKLFNFILLGSLFAITGCNTTKLANSIDGTLVRTAGNKPPAFFSVANVETMRDYVFEANGFSFKFPIAKQSDFSKMGGWSGMSMRDGRTIAFGFDKSITYHVELNYDTFEYGERERAVESNNINYIKNLYHRYNPNSNISIRNYGKENYSSVIIEREEQGFKNSKKKTISYKCYQSNSIKTKANSVTVILTYNKPKDPKLAKEYTYADLTRRAGRMLDSLYIKDGW